MKKKHIKLIQKALIAYGNDEEIVEVLSLLNKKDNPVPSLLDKLKTKYYSCNDAHEFLQYFKQLAFQNIQVHGVETNKEQPLNDNQNVDYTKN